MAVPKRRTGRKRKLQRRSHDALKTPNFLVCKGCGASIPPHRICPDCGYYKEKKYI